jgi:hypothetical protein
MSTDRKPEDQITEANAVELEETQLDNASGGAIGIIAVSHEVIGTSSKTVSADGSVNVALGDGSVRF